MKKYLFLVLLFLVIGLAGCTKEEDKTPTTPTVDIADATFTGVANVTIKAGDEFDPMAGISAADPDGTSLNTKIRIVYVGDELDTETAGTYTLKYRVRGANGNIVDAERTVVVTE